MENLSDNFGIVMAAAELGYRCIPCLPGTKVPALKWKRYQTEPPTEAEYKRILTPKMMNFPRMPNTPHNAAFYTAFYQDLFWALLNSNEFILNH